MDVVNFTAIIAQGRQITELQLENEDLLIIGKKVQNTRTSDNYQNFAVSIEDFIDLLPPPVSTNIYNTDDKLTGKRTVDFNGHTLTFGLNNDAKVGINDTPTYELHVFKSGLGNPVTAALETGASKYARLQYKVGGSDIAHLTLHGKTDSAGTLYQAGYVLARTTAGNVVISNESDVSAILMVVNSGTPATGTVPELYITQGKVSVNTTALDATLTVKGATSGNAAYTLILKNSADNPLARMRDDGGIIIGLNANAAIGSAASIIIGQEAVASGAGAVAIGIYSNVTKVSATGVGTQSSATGDYAAAIGSYGTASGYASITLGSQNVASGPYAISVGLYTTASGHSSVAIGQQALANSLSSLAYGSYAEARAQDTFAVGYFTKASHRGALVMGYGDYGSGYMESTHTDALFLGWLSTTPSFAFSKTADSYLNGAGNVGVGTAAGIASKLTVNGDVETLTNTRGLIVLDRTNGTRYRIFTNAGVLSVEAA